VKPIRCFLFFKEVCSERAGIAFWKKAMPSSEKRYFLKRDRSSATESQKAWNKRRKKKREYNKQVEQKRR